MRVGHAPCLRISEYVDGSRSRCLGSGVRVIERPHFGVSMKPAHLVAALLAAFTLDASANLQPGHLDPTFGVDGRQTIPADIATAREVNAVTTLVGPDERIYVVTTARTAEKVETIAIIRLDANGAIDGGFGEQGVAVHLPQGVSRVVARDAAFDDEGRLIVAGEATVGAADAMIACRFGSDGSADLGFGRPQTPGCYSLAADEGVAHGVIVQHGTGRVIMSGKVLSGGRALGTIIGLLPDGSGFDSEFGAGFGLRFFPSELLVAKGASEFLDIAQHSDGSFAVAGYIGPVDSGELAGQFGFVVYWLDEQGDPSSFGFSGLGVMGFADELHGPIAKANAVMLAEDGSVFMAGYVQRGTFSFYPAVSRMLPNGHPDPGFDYENSTKGPDLGLIYDLCDQPCDMRAHEAFLQPDGKIVLSGTIRQGDDGDDAGSLAGKSDFFVMRLLPNGKPDPTFRSPDSSRDGLSIVPFNTYSEPREDNAYGLAMQDGCLLVAGLARTDKNPNNDVPEFHAAIARIGNGDPLFDDGFE